MPTYVENQTHVHACCNRTHVFHTCSHMSESDTRVHTCWNWTRVFMCVKIGHVCSRMFSRVETGHMFHACGAARVWFLTRCEIVSLDMHVNQTRMSEILHAFPKLHACPVWHRCLILHACPIWHTCRNLHMGNISDFCSNLPALLMSWHWVWRGSYSEMNGSKRRAPFLVY